MPAVRVWICTEAAWAPGEVGEPGLLALLDSSERARWERLRPPRSKLQFVRAHAFCRLVLGAVTGDDPAGLVVEVGPSGKPLLAGGALPHFNLSHSRGTVAVAVADHRPVGVDVEHERPVDVDALVARFFTPSEQARIRGEPEAARSAAFFRAWVRKEAVVKAAGTGLSVVLGSTEPGRSLTLRWWVAPFQAAPGCPGAVAAEGGGWELEVIRVDDVRELPEGSRALAHPSRSVPPERGVPPDGPA